MKNQLIYAVFLLATASFSACSSSPKQENQEVNTPSEKSFYELDLSKDFSGSDNQTLLLSDIVENVEYVKLETTDDCLLDSYVSLFTTDEDIYALNKNYTNEELFRFDRKTGRFISQIGSIGQGPKEMIKPSFVFAKDSLVYVSSNISEKVYVYTNENQFVRSVPFCKDRSSFEDGIGETISVIDHQYIVRHPGQLQSQLNYNQYMAAEVIDMNSNRLFAMRDTSDVYGIMLSLDWDPVRWYYKGNINFYNEPDRTVYAVTKDSIIPRYHFNLGDNKWPVKSEKLTMEYIKHIKFKSFRETEDYLYLYWNQREKGYFARFNKKTEKLDVQEQEKLWGRTWILKVPGLKNDIDGCNLNVDFIRLMDEQSSIVVMISATGKEDYIKVLKESQEVKFPEKRQQLLKLLEEMGEEDNQILAIYKLKK
ncbi:MAG: 6-bladed beta-propeller [Bacteroides sp.]|nr:6-bladed beta-propeller [Bacteroides sp.]